MAARTSKRTSSEPTRRLIFRSRVVESVNGIKLLLFGISGMLYAGFLMLGGYGGDGTLFWLLSLGFAVSVGGLLTSDRDRDRRSDGVDGGDGDGDSPDDSGEIEESDYREAGRLRPR